MERINRKQKRDVKQLEFLSLFSLLGITEEEIDRILSGKAYTSKKIKGKRILVPCKDLKVIQKKLAFVFNNLFFVHPSVHSYSKRRSILTCIDRHKWAKKVLCIDVKNFFESILEHEVRSYFKKTHYMIKDLLIGVLTESFDIDLNKIVDLFLADGIKEEDHYYIRFSDHDIKLLVKCCCYNGHLPIGAPTSPALSNVILSNLDERLSNFAYDRGFKYSRYADDIFFSCEFDCIKDSDNPKFMTRDRAGLHRHNLRKFLPVAIDILKYYGFKVNYKKLKYIRNIKSKKLFNITLNDDGKRSVCRKYRRRVRAERHQLELHKSNAKKGDGLLDYRQGLKEEKVQGKEAWIKHVDNRQPEERPKEIQVPVDENPFLF